MRPRYVLVLGAPGAGKSDFVCQCAGNASSTKVDFRFSTADVQEWSFELAGRGTIHLIDTPEIGNPELDFEVVPLIASRLVEMYREGQSLAAVLFFYSAAGNRFSDGSRRALEILKQICAKECFQEVILVATQAGRLDGDEERLSPDRGGRAEHPSEMDDMVRAGARKMRYSGGKDLALTILKSCIQGPRTVTLQVQHELVDQGEGFVRTMTGRQLKADMLETQQVLMQDPLRLQAEGVGGSPLKGRTSSGTIDRKVEENETACRRIESRRLASTKPARPVPRPSNLFREFQSLTLKDDSASNRESVSQARDPLSEAIATGSLNFLQMILERDFASVTKGPWEWLTELEQLGYSKKEMAELLLEQKTEKPWIVFSPWILEDRSPVSNFHVPGCVHRGGRRPPTISLEGSTLSPDAAQNLRCAVTSLCGLGGVIPSSQEKIEWKALVDFPDNSSVNVDYKGVGTDISVLARYLATTIRRICTALAIAQDTNACCDRFTVLVERPGSNVITMRTINITEVMDFRDHLQNIQEGRCAASLTRCRDTAWKVLDLPATLRHGESDVFQILHNCSLAVQFLSLGLVSYCQAHIGRLGLFFLEKKLASIKLLGSAPNDSSAVWMSADLQRFTCLDDMAHAPVLVFTQSDTATSSPQLDLFAKPEDILDTWGPGEMIRRSENDVTRFRALTVRGGMIHRSSGMTFHWGRLDSQVIAADDETFAMNEPIRIGAELNVNRLCKRNEQHWIQLCQAHTRPLGTTPTRMRQQGLEFGAQAGQFGLATFNLVLEKVPGVSLKDVMIERLRMGQDYASFLAAPCGLQVSFCSGLARRVRMRDLLAELLPVYIKRTMPWSRHWFILFYKYKLVKALSGRSAETMTNCLQRMHQSDPASFQYLWALTFDLVSSMRSTGYDAAAGAFTVAIVPSSAEEPLNRVLFGLSGPNYWTRALRDTDTCATFAYFTLTCLQVDGMGCRKTKSSWHRRVLMLQTEIVINTSGHSLREVPEPWSLADGESYRLGSPDADDHVGILVDVVRPQPNRLPRLVVRRSLTPLWVWKRLAQKRHMHLQERLGPSDSVLRAFMTSTEDTAAEVS